jgi:hypothetical protein
MAFIRNVGRVAEHVGLILKNGTKAFGRVMPRNKGVTLPEGAKLDPKWMALYGKNIRYFGDDTQSPGWTIVAPTGSATPAQQTNNGAT